MNKGITITQDVAKLLEIRLRNAGYSLTGKQYCLFEARKDGAIVCVYNTKGFKVLIQGSNTRKSEEIVADATGQADADIGPTLLEPHFGIDESGKGDLFGPLVVAGVYVTEKIARILAAAGVMDSKAIQSPEKIRKLAKIIRETPGIIYALNTYRPVAYNESYAEDKNLNKLLAKGHAHVIKALKETVPDCKLSLSDQFSPGNEIEQACRKAGVPEELEITQRPKGETDIAVAAASILARDNFLYNMQKLQQEANNRGYTILIPLGASDRCTAAAQAFADAGADMTEWVKTHFKTAPATKPGHTPFPKTISNGVSEGFIPTTEAPNPQDKIEAILKLCEATPNAQTLLSIQILALELRLQIKGN